MRTLYLVKQYNPKGAMGKGEWTYAYVGARSATDAVRLFLTTHDEVGQLEVEREEKPFILEEQI